MVLQELRHQLPSCRARRLTLDVHTQVRAWRFAPVARSERGPILESDEKRVRVLRTSLTEVEGAERLDCSDASLWIVETEPLE